MEFNKTFQVEVHLSFSFNTYFGLLDRFSVSEDNIFQN